MKNLIIVFSILWLVGCSSSEKDDSDFYHPSTFNPAANAVDGFYVDPPAPSHDKPTRDIDFWIGDCSRDTAGSPFSKSAYSCANR